MNVIECSPVLEDSGCYLMARIRGTDAANIVQADISSIDLAIHCSDGTDNAVGAIVVSSVVFNTLQTDARWTVDSTGYNFRYNATAAQLDDGGRVYTYEFKITPASGQVFHVVFKVPTENLFRS